MSANEWTPNDVWAQCVYLINFYVYGCNHSNEMFSLLLRDSPVCIYTVQTLTNVFQKQIQTAKIPNRRQFSNEKYINVRLWKTENIPISE